MARSKYPEGIRTPRQRDAYVFEQARKWADSGECEGWLMVERTLVERGFSTARDLLDNGWIREDLDHRCAAAIRRRKDEAAKHGETFEAPRTPVKMVEPTSTSEKTIRMNPLVDG
jgi:hypothetical protein